MKNIFREISNEEIGHPSSAQGAELLRGGGGVGCACLLAIRLPRIPFLGSIPTTYTFQFLTSTKFEMCVVCVCACVCVDGGRGASGNEPISNYQSISIFFLGFMPI